MEQLPFQHLSSEDFQKSFLASYNSRPYDNVTKCWRLPLLRFRIESQRPKAKTIAYLKITDLSSMITSQKRVLAASKSISSSRNCVNKITSVLRLRAPGNNRSPSISVKESAHQAMLIGELWDKDVSFSEARGIYNIKFCIELYDISQIWPQ